MRKRRKLREEEKTNGCHGQEWLIEEAEREEMEEKIEMKMKTEEETS